MVCHDDPTLGLCSGRGQCIDDTCVCDSGWNGRGTLVWSDGTDCFLNTKAVNGLLVLNVVTSVLALLVVLCNLGRRIGSGQFERAYTRRRRTTQLEQQQQANAAAAAAGGGLGTVDNNARAHSPRSGSTAGDGGTMARVTQWVGECCGPAWAYPNRLYLTCLACTAANLAWASLRLFYAGDARAIGSSWASVVLWIVWMQTFNWLSHDSGMQTLRMYDAAAVSVRGHGVPLASAAAAAAASQSSSQPTTLQQQHDGTAVIPGGPSPVSNATTAASPSSAATTTTGTTAATAASTPHSHLAGQQKLTPPAPRWLRPVMYGVMVFNTFSGLLLLLYAARGAGAVNVDADTADGRANQQRLAVALFVAYAIEVGVNGGAWWYALQQLLKAMTIIHANNVHQQRQSQLHHSRQNSLSGFAGRAATGSRPGSGLGGAVRPAPAPIGARVPGVSGGGTAAPATAAAATTTTGGPGSATSNRFRLKKASSLPPGITVDGQLYDGGGGAYSPVIPLGGGGGNTDAAAAVSGDAGAATPTTTTTTASEPFMMRRQLTVVVQRSPEQQTGANLPPAPSNNGLFGAAGAAAEEEGQPSAAAAAATHTLLFPPSMPLPTILSPGPTGPMMMDAAGDNSPAGVGRPITAPAHPSPALGGASSGGGGDLTVVTGRTPGADGTPLSGLGLPLVLAGGGVGGGGVAAYGNGSPPMALVGFAPTPVPPSGRTAMVGVGTAASTATSSPGAPPTDSSGSSGGSSGGVGSRRGVHGGGGSADKNSPSLVFASPAAIRNLTVFASPEAAPTPYGPAAAALGLAKTSPTALDTMAPIGSVPKPLLPLRPPAVVVDPVAPAAAAPSPNTIVITPPAAAGSVMVVTPVLTAATAAAAVVLVAPVALPPMASATAAAAPAPPPPASAVPPLVVAAATAKLHTKRPSLTVQQPGALAGAGAGSATSGGGGLLRLSPTHVSAIAPVGSASTAAPFSASVSPPLLPAAATIAAVQQLPAAAGVPATKSIDAVGLQPLRAVSPAVRTPPSAQRTLQQPREPQLRHAQLLQQARREQQQSAAAAAWEWEQAQLAAAAAAASNQEVLRAIRRLRWLSRLLALNVFFSPGVFVLSAAWSTLRARAAVYVLAGTFPAGVNFLIAALSFVFAL